jgi:AraC-like DNA-binding protein
LDLRQPDEDALDLRPAPGAGFVRGGLARTLGPFLARYPRLPVRELLDEAGILPEQLGDPNAWISVRRSSALFEAAAIATNDPAFTLSFAAQIPLHDLGVFAHIMLSSPTIGGAFANGCRYFGLQTTGASVRLVVEGRDAELSYGIHDPTIVRHGQNTEMVFTLLTRLTREATGDPRWAPREIRFRHRRPANVAVQQAMFRCPLVFDQPDDALVVSPDDLRTRLQKADAVLLRSLVAGADASLPADAEAQSFHHHLRRAVAASLRSGDIAIEHVAMRLDTSARTIQRRLQERGQTFQALVAETRLALAQHYLHDASRSLTDTAFLLGYSDLSAFSRAFRRWTGQSALEFRRRLPVPQERHRRHEATWA